MQGQKSKLEITLHKITSLDELTHLLFKIGLSLLFILGNALWMKWTVLFRFVSSPEEVLEVIEEGKSNRHIAVTSKEAKYVAQLDD